MSNGINDDRITPRAYVTSGYLEYQKKYAENPRESDKKLLALLERAEPRLVDGGKWHGALLDIGCSNGNFLRFLTRCHPDLKCTGGELFPEIIERNSRDAEMRHIEFREMDLLSMNDSEKYDVVVANAILFRFGDRDFEIAIKNLSNALRPGGLFLCFEWVHPFEQLLSITEYTKEQPQGLILHMRSYSSYRVFLNDCGLTDVQFEPFEIPIDLPRSEDTESMITFTVRTSEGRRLNFRGALYQPWCHVIAKKA